MSNSRYLLCATVLALGSSLASCFSFRASQGGGQVSKSTLLAAERADFDPASIVLPPGYAIERVARHLTFPTGVTFDDEGRVYVVESGYSYGETWTTPRLLRIEDANSVSEVARGDDNRPWNGVFYKDGTFYISEGGRKHGGRVLAVDRTGQVRRLVEDLPSFGDHQVNGPVIGPDGALYFSIGTATNSGVVGKDSLDMGWLRDHRDFHDVPCADVVLNGVNFESEDVLGSSTDSMHRISTGAFQSFGTSTRAGQVIAGQIPCSGAVLRIPIAGGKLDLVAWGFRNPFGLAFSPNGQLFVSDNGYDDRGSRPVFGAGDVLWRVTPGAWFGWPDFAGDKRLDHEHFGAPDSSGPQPLLASLPSTPPTPAAIFGVHSSSDGFDFSFAPEFGYVGQAFVAQFGDEAPTTGKVMRPVGFKVVRVDVDTGVIEDFAVNRGDKNGPASKLGSGGLERPLSARFDPTGKSLYVVDFGVLTQDDGAHPEPKTGCVWRIYRIADASSPSMQKR